MQSNKIDWKKLLVSYLHDPPDKVINIKEHEKKSAIYLQIIFGYDYSTSAIHDETRAEDILASGYERILLPKPVMGSDNTDLNLAVSPKNNKIRIVHPLSGLSRELDISSIQSDVVQKVLNDKIKAIETNSDEERFYVIWRFLREFLALENNNWLFLPADTRLPDATIWNHVEIATGFKAAFLAQPNASYALLAFALSPVQGFIESARSAKDLWAGSYLLSKLTFAGMVPILDALGPCVFVYPSLHGNPFLDEYITKEKKFKLYQKLLDIINPLPILSKAKIASLPNKFFAIVPEDSHPEHWANLVENAVREAWEKICKDILERKFLSDDTLGNICLKNLFDNLDPNWDNLWDWQINNYFDIHAVVVPTSSIVLKHFFGENESGDVFPNIKKFQELANCISETDRYSSSIHFKDQKNKIGIWMIENKIASLLLDAKRSIRHIPNNDPKRTNVAAPPKCTMFGSFEQMGPAELNKSSDFWENAAKKLQEKKCFALKKRERLCALGLVKRFYSEMERLHFPDAATIAAKIWLKHNNIDPEDYWKNNGYWNGQWLHWEDLREAKEEDFQIPDKLRSDLTQLKKSESYIPPPKYYAVLLLDGDHMGRWIQGEFNPPIGTILDKIFIDYFFTRNQNNKETIEKLLKTQKLVSPALHTAISEALCNFSLKVVPEVVAKFNGELIYAGGDDVLALLPLETVIDCANQLYLAFRGELHKDQNCPIGYYLYNNQQLLMMGSTATASAGILIAHYKENLKQVISEARSALKSAKKKGRNQFCISIIRRSGTQTSAFASWESAGHLQNWVNHFRTHSDRWTYTLRKELPVLSVLDDNTFENEIKRLISRDIDEKSRQETLKLANTFWKNYQQWINTIQNNEINSKENFVNLLQSTSFLARGRD